jgi:hypothetical protein
LADERRQQFERNRAEDERMLAYRARSESSANVVAMQNGRLIDIMSEHLMPSKATRPNEMKELRAAQLATQKDLQNVVGLLNTLTNDLRSSSNRTTQLVIQVDQLTKMVNRRPPGT